MCPTPWLQVWGHERSQVFSVTSDWVFPQGRDYNIWKRPLIRVKALHPSFLSPVLFSLTLSPCPFLGHLPVALCPCLLSFCQMVSENGFILSSEAVAHGSVGASASLQRPASGQALMQGDSWGRNVQVAQECCKI